MELTPVGCPTGQDHLRQCRRERAGKREGGRERNIDVKETHRVATTHTTPTGAEDELQPRAINC